MTEVLQVVEKLGFPYGMLVVLLVVLWKENRRLHRLNEGLHERLERRAGMTSEESLEKLVALTAKNNQAVKRILARARKGSRTDPTIPTDRTGG
ncbi:MAG: hypothetical protein WC713_08655 [Candidatus Methylomirabilota bacterium]